MNDGLLESYKKFGISRNKITGEINLDFAKGQEETQKLVAKGGTAALEQWADMLGISKDQAQLIEERGKQIEAARQEAQKSLDAFGINDQMVADNSRAAVAINAIWFDVDNAWKNLLTTAEKPLTNQLEKLDKWMKENPDTVHDLLVLGGAVTAAGGFKVVGGVAARALGFGGPSRALTGSATALSGSAKALDEAALKLGAVGGKGGVPGEGPGRSPTGLVVPGMVAAATGVVAVANAPNTGIRKWPTKPTVSIIGSTALCLGNG